MLTKGVAAVALVAAAAGCAGPVRRDGAPASPAPVASTPAATPPAASATSSAAPTPASRLPGLPASPLPSSTMRCLTGTSRFSLDQERTTDELCLIVGAVVDLPARAGTWTGVRSSDPAVLGCDLRQGVARCQAVAAGRASVTASDGSGTWQLTVYVG